MPSYTVKSGDTLSGIGAAHGVNWQSIKGYKSGNPNLIFPGEVLSWGGGGGSKTSTATAPKPKSSSPNAVTLANREVKAADRNVDSLTGQLTDFDANAKNPIDIYNATLESLGIGDARTRVSGLREQLLNTENLVRSVAGDVQARTSEALVTENQKRRLVAMEQEPLTEKMRIEGRNLEVALGDYKDIMSEGKAQTEMEYMGQQDKRDALMDRLKIAIDKATTAESKRRYEKDYARLVKKDREEAKRWEKEFQLSKQEFAWKKANAIADRNAANARAAASRNSGPTKDEQAAMNYSNAFNDIRDWKPANGNLVEAPGIGSNNKANPKAYNAARSNWMSAGLGAKAWNDQFSWLVNNSNYKAYSGASALSGL